MPSAGAIVPPLINPLRTKFENSKHPSTYIDTGTYIELATETPECKIYFSTDGTKPNPFQLKISGRETTFKYRGPFTLKTGKRTLKVVAVSRDGLHESNVVTKTFQVADIGPPDDDGSYIDLDPWQSETLPSKSASMLRNTGMPGGSRGRTGKKSLRGSRSGSIKEAWGTDNYEYVNDNDGYGTGGGEVITDKTPDNVSNSVALPEGPVNGPTNYSGTQYNFWGVNGTGGPLPMMNNNNNNPLGGMSLPYGTTPNQLGCMANGMLHNLHQPKVSLEDLKRLVQPEKPPQPAIQEIPVPKEPEAKPESPGDGDWKGQLEHIYAHLIARCKNNSTFRNKIGDPVMGKILQADIKEDGNVYNITLCVGKPGVNTVPKRKPSIVRAPPAPKPAPPVQAPPPPKVKPKPAAPPPKKAEPKPKPKPEKPKPEPKKDPFFVTEEYEAEATLKPWEFFNAERDCEALRGAMKGVGTDERVIVDIMGYRISSQRQEIVKMFKTMFGKDLRQELVSETSSDFKEVLKALCLPPDEYDASEIKRAVKGLGTDEDALIEILCTRTNAQIKAIKEAYTRLYDKDLLKDVKSDTSGDFKQLLTFQIQGQRNESPEYDQTEADADAQNLYKAGEGKKWGTDESTFNQIILRRSFAHLRAVFEAYGKISKRDIEEAIKSEFSGDIKNSLIAVVRVIRNKPAYFARKLQKAMKGAGTDDGAMVRIVVSRCEIDMVQIKEAFTEVATKGGPLGDWIKDDTSGDYREMLMALIGERAAPVPTADEIEEAEGEPELEEAEEEEVQEDPTLVPADPFDAKQDCQVLMKAMKGLGTDEKAIIEVLCRRSGEQRAEIVKTYRETIGKDLKKELHGELSGNFRDAILGLCLSPTEFDAEQLRKAMKGAGTDEDCLIEILCTRNNTELEAIIAKYHNLYNRKLEEDIISETSGNLKRLLVSMLQAHRPDGNVIDRRKARKDAKDLMEAGEKKMGTDESRFNVILCSRSFAQLRATFEEYAKVANKEIEDTIKSEMSGDLKRGMLTVVGVIRNKQFYFADQLYRSMKGLGTKDDSLVRTVVTRAEVDMVQVKEKFETRHAQPLGKFIKDDTSGDYRKTLLTLIGEEGLIKKK